MRTETCTHTQNNMICIHTYTQANLHTHNNNFIHRDTDTHTHRVTMSSGDGGAFLGIEVLRSYAVLIIMIKRFMIMHFMPAWLLPSPCTVMIAFVVCE